MSCLLLTSYALRMQVTYDKLETQNVYSKRFGKCRGDDIKLHNREDTTLLIGKDAGRYKACGQILLL